MFLPATMYKMPDAASLNAALLSLLVVMVQVGKSYSNVSMLSATGENIIVSSTNKIAVYKGLTVAVYIVDKTEVNLTRQDLVELINVCSVFTVCI